MEKKQTRRESRETAFLTAFAATFEPETPLVPAETESAAPDAFATQLLAAMNDHAAELDEIITAHLKGWTLARVPASAWWPCASAWLRCCMARSRRPVSPSTKLLSLSKSNGADNDYQFVQRPVGLPLPRERGEQPVAEAAQPQC